MTYNYTFSILELVELEKEGRSILDEQHYLIKRKRYQNLEVYDADEKRIQDH